MYRQHVASADLRRPIRETQRATVPRTEATTCCRRHVCRWRSSHPCLSHIQSTSELASASSFSSGLWRLRRGAALAAPDADAGADEDEDDADFADEDDAAAAAAERLPLPPEREAELVAGDAWAALAAADLADLDALAPAVAAADEDEDEDEAEPRLRLPLLLVVASFPVPPVRRVLETEAALSPALFAAARADMAATESIRQEMAGSSDWLARTAPAVEI